MPIANFTIPANGAKAQWSENRRPEALHGLQCNEYGLGVLQEQSAVSEAKESVGQAILGSNIYLFVAGKGRGYFCLEEKRYLAVLGEFLLLGEVNDGRSWTVLDAFAQKHDVRTWRIDRSVEIKHSSIFESHVRLQLLALFKRGRRGRARGRQAQLIFSIGTGKASGSKVDATQFQARNFIQSRPGQYPLRIARV